MKIITGFHAIEEIVKANISENADKSNIKLLYSKIGPRVKKILKLAEDAHIVCESKDNNELNSIVKNLPDGLKEHRGLVLIMQNDSTSMSIDELLANLACKEKACILLLDSITDPHNIGSIVRSADQFGADAIILPERNSAGSFEVIAKISSGASAWVPIVYVKNLTRITNRLKEEGFWIYGADANGENLRKISFPQKKAIIMGSEGKGIGQNLKQNCDVIVSIPTVGKLDSLNVSVAAGILLYEINK